jgi:hypothetical protein
MSPSRNGLVRLAGRLGPRAALRGLAALYAWERPGA